jgi:hypothetical protein
MAGLPALMGDKPNATGIAFFHQPPLACKPGCIELDTIHLHGHLTRVFHGVMLFRRKILNSQGFSDGISHYSGDHFVMLAIPTRPERTVAAGCPVIIK